MKWVRKFWKPLAVGLGLLCLLVLTRCHFVPLPMRRADQLIEMKTTGYCACGKCCGWKRTWYGKPVYTYGLQKGKFKKVGRTASGRQARPGTVAVDTSRYPLGTKFYIPGYGWGIARDVGGAIKQDHLDLFHRTHRSALKWGVQIKRVKVWFPKID